MVTTFDVFGYRQGHKLLGGAQDILDRLKFRREFTPDIANIYWSIFDRYTSDHFGGLIARIPGGFRCIRVDWLSTLLAPIEDH